MTGTINPSSASPSASPTSAGAMLNYLRNSCMPERRDWNAMGTPLPLWFRLHLRRIDPNLVLQFVPPSSHAKGGCDPSQNPFGVWAICRRMRNTRLLCKRWVYSMSTPNGAHLTPTRDLVCLLERAARMWRAGRMGELEDAFDRNMAQKLKDNVAKSKERVHARIEDRMRRMGLRDHPSRPLIVPITKIPSWLKGRTQGRTQGR